MHATSTPTLAQPKNGAFAALGAAAILTAAIGFGAVIGMNLPTAAAPTAGAGSATQIESGLRAKNLGNAAAIVAAGTSALAIEQGLAAKQAGEAAASSGAGSALAIEGAVDAKSDAGANAPVVILPFEIGGRDPQATFNGVPGLSAQDIARAEGGWYAFPPVVTLPPYPVPGYPPVNRANVSAHDAARAAAGWYAYPPLAEPVPVPIPSILYNVGPGLSTLEAERAAKGQYGAAQDPATNMSDQFSVRTPWGGLSYDQIRGMDGWKPFATVPQAPTTDLGDIVPGLDSGSAVVLSNDQIRAMVERNPFPTLVQDPDGNTDKVGTSHR